eukprot:Filipodium_phascolosomae@DN2803_c0_g1_i6.p1
MQAFLISVAVLALIVAGERFPNWDPTKTYSGGAKVVKSQKLYLAKWWSPAGAAPDAVVENNPWTLEDANYGPGAGGDPAPTITATSPPPVEGDWPQYRAGGTYNSGDEVLNQGQVYKCKAGVAAWCGGAAAAYAPGVGSAWSSA